jgi:hypothetical protein
MGHEVHANGSGVAQVSAAAATYSYQALLDLAREEALSGVTAFVPVSQQAILNGVPYRAFRQSVALDDRREAGTFFSGTELAHELADLLHSRMPTGARVLDPTCGMGDLLLAYAALLPIADSLEETLTSWGEQLAGIDTRAELVAMAKARLIALARARGRFGGPLNGIDDLFPNIVVGNMFGERARLAEAHGFLFNPPFGGTTAHYAPSWGSGKLSSAALFLDALITASSSSAPIAAVLPEVLRCGSRYAMFRARLSELGISGDFTSRGRFDAWTDVDVFTTLLNRVSGSLWPADTTTGQILDDRFSVCVGAVVPHRHENKGPWRHFICAKSVPAWSDGFRPNSSRRFKGTVFQPPFVVVRRTSSPSDRKRAVGAIILGDRPIAVENHLIVLMPKEGGYETCRALLAVLDSDITTNHLNRSIRCRHLTTGSVKAIPWPDK